MVWWGRAGTHRLVAAQRCVTEQGWQERRRLSPGGKTLLLGIHSPKQSLRGASPQFRNSWTKITAGFLAEGIQEAGTTPGTNSSEKPQP